VADFKKLLVWQKAHAMAQAHGHGRLRRVMLEGSPLIRLRRGEALLDEIEPLKNKTAKPKTEKKKDRRATKRATQNAKRKTHNAKRTTRSLRSRVGAGPPDYLIATPVA